MYGITRKEQLAEDTFLLAVEDPLIAEAAEPGQFIMVRADADSERIPLTIADSSKDDVVFIFKTVGDSTKRMAEFTAGNELHDIAGPLGRPSRISCYGSVCLVAGGVGAAAAYPIAKAMKAEGNRVVIIAGFRNMDNVFWEQKLKDACDELMLCTDDGSYGRKGFVTDALSEITDGFDLVIAVGPVIMMKNVAKVTEGMVKTYASLNPIMVDGMGMCGGCRVKVGGCSKFACVDGPEFDAHEVDWDLLIKRNNRFEVCSHENKDA